MKINKEKILQKAFEQYLLRGYSGVSISVLQQQLNIGRATLYYYFKDKETLFKAILDKYFIQVIQTNEDISPDITICELIEKRIAISLQLKASILTLENQTLTMSNFSALLLFAYTHYDHFKDFVRESQQRCVQQWQLAIRNSIKQSEIKPDVNIDVLASLFANIKDGYEAGLFVEPTMTDVFLKTSYYYLYNLVKSGTKTVA